MNKSDCYSCPIGLTIISKKLISNNACANCSNYEVSEKITAHNRTQKDIKLINLNEK